MGKCQLERNERIKFIQLAEVEDKGRGVILADRSAGSQEWRCADRLLLFLAGPQASTLIGRREGVCSFLSVWVLFT